MLLASAERAREDGVIAATITAAIAANNAATAAATSGPTDHPPARAASAQSVLDELLGEVSGQDGRADWSHLVEPEDLRGPADASEVGGTGHGVTSNNGNSSGDMVDMLMLLASV